MEETDFLEDIINGESSTNLKVVLDKPLTIYQERDFEEKHWQFKYRIKALTRLNKAYINGENLKILNIGVGTGTIAKDLEKYGECTHIDISKEVIEANTELKIQQGKFPYDNHLKLEEKYDYIILYNLLEYMTNINWVLDITKSRLKPDGKILISTIIGNGLTEEDKMYHIVNKYSLKKIENILNQLNLKIDNYTYFEGLSTSTQLKDSLNNFWDENALRKNIIPKENDILFNYLMEKEYPKLGIQKINQGNQIFMSIKFLTEAEKMKINADSNFNNTKSNFINKIFDKFTKK